MKKKIILNCVPPTMENMPSPAFSVLKPELEKHGYNVDIIYWNVKFTDMLKSFLNFGIKIYENEYHKLLPFFGCLAIDYEDDACLEALCYAALSIKPNLHSKGIGYVREEFYKFHKQINNTLEDFIENTDLSKYLFLGFSSLFYQWIIAVIFANKIKQKYPNLPIVIGGTGTREEAVAMLRNFQSFDYVSWGEGEYSLVKLSEYLEGKISDIEEVPHTAYRTKGEISYSRKTTQYADIDVSKMDFSDYVKIQGNVDKDLPSINLPLEGGRGCHWKKCHFCFLNTGYKTRPKSVDSICKEIRYYIDTYKISSFLFLDNDVIGADLKRFDELLDELIKLKEEYNDLTIIGAEIVSKDVPYTIIKKMGIVNFEAVQVGYESPSNNILHKIEKKNTFASNLFFIKWATYFGIKINGANILRNLLEETVDDIKEGLTNLHTQRFYLDYALFKHNQSDLGISQSSRYYKQLEQDNRLSEWGESSLYNLIPKKFIFPEDKYNLFLNFVKRDHHPLWDLFNKVEEHYLNNMYAYKLFANGDTIYYREIYNGLIVNELEFNDKEVYWQILHLCNKAVLSLAQIAEQLCILVDEAKEAVEQLQKESLLYHNNDYSEIVTIINPDLIN